MKKEFKQKETDRHRGQSIKYLGSLRPLKREITKYDISSFDIETYGEYNDFLMGSILYYSGKNRYEEKELKKKIFWNKKQMINFLINNERFYRNNILFATNLSFDLLALFENTEEFKNLRFMLRQSRMLMGKYIKPNKIRNKNRYNTIKFYDTLNHAKMSVENIGKFLGIPKYEKPSFLGEKPVDSAEKKILEEYNIQDSFITLKFAQFLQDNYNKIGCNIKCTLPSSCMDLFRRTYLNESIMQPQKQLLEKFYNAYYGGRTEVIKRGNISGKNLKLYDINSLYPSVMSFYEYPNSNYCYHRKYNVNKKDFYVINNYEGISNVELICPEHINIPYLPVRYNNKLIFPTGYIKGWYTNFEIRNSIKLGYKILKVHESIFYTKTHNPFKDFVNDMYSNRMKHKIEGESIEMVYKILMNSLYGKFAQKLEPEDEIRDINSFTKEEFFKIWNNKNINAREVNGYLYFKNKEIKRVPKYINPIYSIHVTAYARNYLYKSLPKDVYYMDTDSCITKQELKTGNMLGEWKEEATIKEGLIVKPKFYFRDEIAKVKGCGKITVNDVKELIATRQYSYEKLFKFKEAIRRNKSFNQRTKVTKNLSLEDDKRIWFDKFNPEELQESKPIALKIHDYQ